MPPRQQVTLEQRQALRNWASQQHPRPSQKACITWFETRFNLRISQSTVSQYLSSRIEASITSLPADRSRLRLGQWPDLENILYNWQRHIEAKGGVTSGEILQERARQIWHQLPKYSGLPCPEFSIGWLQKFKKRHGIQEHTRHGELGSVPESAEDDMKSIRTLAGEYNEQDIYNMDETALYWRMMPSRGLATQQQPGVKKDKARISLVLAVNASGTDRLPIWIIGKHKTPRALRNICVKTMGAEWRWNTKAWMTTQVMSEWLLAFYAHIGPQREVLLSMDNFSAHVAALIINPPPANIRISWLPPNSTSRFQPLDQGIIQSFKSHYRRQWLDYMLACFDRNQNPLDSMNLHLAIRWITRSWKRYVSNTTIYNCFRKSTLVTSPISLPQEMDDPNIEGLYNQVRRAGNIQDMMAMSNFLNPLEEEEVQGNEGEDQEPNEVLQDIIREHLGTEQDEEDEVEPQPPKPQRSIQEAIQALQVVIEFTEGREDMQEAQLRAIEQMEEQLRLLEVNGRVQSTLDGWIT